MHAKNRRCSPSNGLCSVQSWSPILPSAIARGTASFPPCSTFSPPSPPPESLPSPRATPLNLEDTTWVQGSRLRGWPIVEPATWPQISSRQFNVALVWKTKKILPLGKVTNPPRPPTPRRYRPRFTLLLALLYGCLIFILDLVVPLYPSPPLINRLASTFSLSLFFFFVHSLTTLFFSTAKVDHRLR